MSNIFQKLGITPQPHQVKFLETNGTSPEETITIVFFGGGAGGGKSWSIYLDNLFGIHDPLYESAFFRSTTKELDTSLWPNALRMYEPILKDENGKWIGKAKVDNKRKIIYFPSGAKSYFSYLQYDSDADSWDGTELAKIYIDELQHHSQYKFDKLYSRNRNAAQVPKGMRLTFNPKIDHWMYDWVKPFLDEHGFPIKEYSGKVRYYIVDGGVLHTSWDKQELENTYGKESETYTYIPATLTDNVEYMKKDPKYKNKLEQLPTELRDALLLGRWVRTQVKGRYWKREWVKTAEYVPEGAIYARGWDTASTENDPKTKYKADWTAGIKMAKHGDNFYLCGMARFQKNPGARDSEIFRLASEVDGPECTIVKNRDVGGAGKSEYTSFAKESLKRGLNCVPDPVAPNKSKSVKFSPFSSACQNGFVYIVESAFTPGELEYLKSELEKFDGSDSNAYMEKFDDCVDATATVFNYLNEEIHIPEFTLTLGSHSTKYGALKQELRD